MALSICFDAEGLSCGFLSSNALHSIFLYLNKPFYFNNYILARDWLLLGAQVPICLGKELSMSCRSNAWPTVFWCVVSVQSLLAGEGPRGHRTQLNVPISEPFSLAEAIHLPEWGEIQRMTELLQTDAGARALLRVMP